MGVCKRVLSMNIRIGCRDTDRQLRPARIISILVFTALVASMFTASPAWAPTTEEPRRIKCGPIKWNGTEFELELAAQFGMATAGENSGFTVATTLEVEESTGGVVTLPTAVHPVEPQRDAVLRQDGLVQLVSQQIRGHVYWVSTQGGDRPRAGEVYPIAVSAASELKNPAGATIATAHLERVSLW